MFLCFEKNILLSSSLPALKAVQSISSLLVEMMSDIIPS